MYDQVQKTVDEAIAAGAEYVVALAHLGDDTESSPWMSTEVIANTSGIDVVLDGHSHSTVPSQTVKNEKGEDVLLSQTGTKAESIGKLTISADGKLSTELVALADVDTTSDAYNQVKSTVESIQKQYQDKANEVVATSKVELTTKDPATGERAVRSAETNLGDLCADAYRALLDADVESLDRLLAPNFIFIGSNGHVQDKEHFLQTIAQKKLVVHKASFKNLRESSAGPVRLVTGNGVFTAVSDVPLPSGLMRVSLVSDCTGKRERIVLVQLTPVIPTAQCEDGNCLIR